MIALAWYFAKVILCSGVLCGYYFLALRNKIFHRWNRFFILFSITISLLLPIISIDLFQTVDRGGVIHLIKSINNQNYSAITYATSFSYQTVIIFIIETISLIITFCLLIKFGYSIVKIHKWKYTYPQNKIGNLQLFQTDLQESPFSFFNSIFWNRSIDLHSSTGNQIFNHELTHVKEKHSHDKIFINLILCFCWINPFFWLLKRELNMIHEFIADQSAVDNDDINAYAQMILTTLYPGRDFSLTNQFFYSPIKRRLLMLTQNKNPKHNYLGRILLIPLLVIIFSAFTLKVKEVITKNINSTPVIGEVKSTPIISKPIFKLKADTAPDFTFHSLKIRSITESGKGYVTLKMEDGTKRTISNNEAKKLGLLPPPPPALTAPLPPSSIKNIPPPPPAIAPPPPPPPPALAKNALYVINGQESTRDEAERLMVDHIASINILKGQHAADKYGEKGKYGVIEISTGTPLLAPRDNSNLNNIASSDDKVFTKTEQEATFPGGTKEWFKYISSIIKNNINSLSVKDNGTCRVRFIVNTDGSVGDVTALNMKESNLAILAIKAIKGGPLWVPAMQNNHIVKAYREQPVTFVITAD